MCVRVQGKKEAEPSSLKDRKEGDRREERNKEKEGE
jgi:hypothetical protein